MRLSRDGFRALPSGDEPDSARHFTETFRRLIRIVEKELPEKHADAFILLLKLLAALKDEGNRKKTIGAPYLNYIERLKERIRKSPNPNHDFRAAAAEMSLSYSHFRRLFRENEGCGPHEYLLRERMAQAAKRLLAPDVQVKEVAFETGYSDSARFSKLFKKKTGLSPREYREMHLL